MEHKSSRLQHQHETREELDGNSRQQQLQSQAQVEFASVEEMLRHDAAQNSPSPSIAERLAKSTEPIRKPGAPWWRRLFSS